MSGDESFQRTVSFLHISPLTFPTFSEIESLTVDVGAVYFCLFKQFFHWLITLLVNLFPFVRFAVMALPIVS
jgi:hypothetical protein